MWSAASQRCFHLLFSLHLHPRCFSSHPWYGVDDQEGGDGDDDQDGGGDGDLPLEKTVVEKPVDDRGSTQRAPHLFAMYIPFSQLNSSQDVFCLMQVFFALFRCASNQASLVPTMVINQKVGRWYQGRTG